MAEIFDVDEEVLTKAIRSVVKKLETAKNKPFDESFDEHDPPFTIRVWYDRDPPQAVNLRITFH